jgi:hypothetical protein
VVLQKDGVLHPATHPKTHPSQGAAETEAKRLSKLAPGDTYVVFRAVSKASTEVPAVKVEAFP